MLCDKVVFLARGGHLAFVGSPARALRYFEADELRRHLRAAWPRRRAPEEWGERFRAVRRLRSCAPEQLGPAPPGATAARGSLGDSAARAGFRRQLRQFAVLSRRNFDIYAKNPKVLPSL